MRLLSFIFIAGLFFSVSVAAQSPLVVRAFEDGIQSAQKREFEMAIKDFRRAILFSETERTSDDFLARIRFNLGACFYNLKQPGKAAAEFTEAIRLSRRRYQKAFYALGMAESDLKNWQKAVTAFREAVAIEKHDGEAWFDLGLALIEEKDFEAAERAFRHAIKQKSISAADAHNNLGVIYVLRADFPAAETEFKTALVKSNNESIEAVNNLQFCRLYKRAFNQNLLAQLEFSRKYKQGE